MQGENTHTNSRMKTEMVEVAKGTLYIVDSSISSNFHVFDLSHN